MELTVSRLSVSLSGADIVKDVSLHVEAGAFVGIVGPNGSGKSTLLKSIYKVLKPKSGAVFLGGSDVLKENPKSVARKMSVVGQFNEIGFDFSVREMVMMGRTPHKKLLEREKEDDLRIADAALETVGLSAYAERSFLTLSGGEKQRVILARAIAQQPKFMILDEPTNHLDIRYQLQILSIVKSLGIGVLAALHDLQLAAAYCDTLYLVADGRVAAAGAPAEVLSKENIRELFGVECEVYTNPITGGLAFAYLQMERQPGGAV